VDQASSPGTPWTASLGSGLSPASRLLACLPVVDQSLCLQLNMHIITTDICHLATMPPCHHATMPPRRHGSKFPVAAASASGNGRLSGCATLGLGLSSSSGIVMVFCRRSSMSQSISRSATRMQDKNTVLIGRMFAGGASWRGGRS
jgi:hypothetical protein